MKENKLHKDTLVIHEGYDEKAHHGSLAVPLYQTSTFSFESAEQGENRFSGEEEGPYLFSSRQSNGTCS